MFNSFYVLSIDKITYFLININNKNWSLINNKRFVSFLTRKEVFIDNIHFRIVKIYKHFFIYWSLRENIPGQKKKKKAYGAILVKY